MSWIYRVFVAIDQLGNAIAGGSPDSTISARTGYFANKDPSPPLVQYWKAMEWMIDTTFYPIDSPNHCLQAYRYDKDEKFREGSDLMRIILSVIIVLVCIPLSLLTWTIGWLFRKPKTA